MREKDLAKREKQNEKPCCGSQKNKNGSFFSFYNPENSSKKGKYTGNPGKEYRDSKHRITKEGSAASLA